MHIFHFKHIGIACVSALLVLTSCNKDKGESSILPVPVQSLFSLGSPVTNPTNAQWCLPEESETTLQSFRHVSKGRLYYMDQYVNIDYPQLLKNSYRDGAKFHEDLLNLFYTPEGQVGLYPEESGSCSGFICHNKEGELLFCRNFDGAGWDSGPCVVMRDHANGFFNIKFCAPLYINDVLYPNDGYLNDGTTSLHQLITLSTAPMDGMNEYGLCYAAYQLPDMLPEWASMHPILNQNTGKNVMFGTLMANLVLGQCHTVSEVETLFRSVDYVVLNPYLNTHWIFADATGDWAIFEYWDNQLYVYRENDLKSMVNDESIPYEYHCIENYYLHKTPYATYDNDEWQQAMTNKSRIRHMMAHYKPIMSEEEALLCLQEGNYGIEEGEDNMTDWSCVYNPSKGTILFNMRDDLSEIYRIDKVSDK